MNTLEILKQTKALLKLYSAWSSGANARDFEGSPTTWTKPDAVSYDLASAICKVAMENKLEGTDSNLEAAAKALRKSAYDRGFNALIKANDIGGFDEVHKILDSAIEDERRRALKFS